MKPEIKVPAVLQSQMANSPVYDFSWNSGWPEIPDIKKPSPEGRTGILFSGTANETIPKRLVLDNRITPLERNCWLVFKMMLDKQGRAAPRYQDLQPYLSMMPYGQKASRETIARVLAILRLTRWITLVTRGRDHDSGQIQGCMYMLNDEPLSVSEVLEFDREYIGFTSDSLSHANKGVCLVAEGAKLDIEESEGYFPARVEILAERMNQNLSADPDRMLGFQHPKERAFLAGSLTHEVIAPLSSDSEPSQINHSSDSELGLNLQSTDSELGSKPSKKDRVRIPNSADKQYCTVLKQTCTSTVLYGQSQEVQWPTEIQLSERERRQIQASLSAIPPEIQQQVLNEAAARIAAGKVRSQAGYLQSLINRAKTGNFKVWQATMRENIASVAATAPPPLSKPHHRGLKSAPEVAKRMMDEIRQRGKYDKKE